MKLFAVVYPGFRGWGYRDQWGGGTFYTGEKIAPFQTYWRSHATIEKADLLAVLAGLGSAPGLQPKFIKDVLKILLKSN